ncbi:BTAD domain-containing putative transcriptional regulator [Actinoplanes sp. NPDC023936]|uniref:AfsR/SARP family transcriptional regulator n=1 Tax=Actinoplanes sp. NPDC023936 TaxID=3154910 RepID=UPI0033CAFD6A
MTTLRYRILGPLSVTDDEQNVAVTATRDRIVLAMLLLRPGRIVGVGELTEAVWGATPPATVRSSYRKALDLWRGPACAEIDAPAVRAAAAVLEERRASAVEDWADLELNAGQARELLGEIAGWVEQFPLRERLHGQLMTALYRSGRQADALAEFRRARDVLRGELGIEPGPELQELHRSMLAGESRAASPASVRSRVRGPCTARPSGWHGSGISRTRWLGPRPGSPTAWTTTIRKPSGSGRTRVIFSTGWGSPRSTGVPSTGERG